MMKTHLLHPPQTFEQKIIEDMYIESNKEFIEMLKEAQILDKAGQHDKAKKHRKRAYLMADALRLADSYATKWHYVQVKFFEYEVALQVLNKKNE